MRLCNTVQCQKTILVWLMLGLPVYAQTRVKLCDWILTSGTSASGHRTGAGDRDGAANTAGATPRDQVDIVLFAQTGCSDRFNSELRIGSDGPCRYTTQPLISDVSSSQSGSVDVDNKTAGDARIPSAVVPGSHSQIDLDNDVYYRNRLEFAFDGGWLPINIPFVFDLFLGDAYNMTPLRYTLVPLVASLRWHIDDVSGPWIFRGNWDMTFSGSITVIPRGPETRYFSYDMGIRRNFVPHRGNIAPYFDGRLGLGEINAKEPLGVLFSQGQNFTFTMNLGSGVRYNFNPRYSFSAGLNWMHISNLYLSEPAFSNYGINVWGPMFGMNVRLSKSRRVSQ